MLDDCTTSVGAMEDSGTLSSTVARPTALFAAPRLRALRLAHLLSQAKLAQAAGVSREAIANLETGGVARAETIHKLADYFGVEPAELMREPE